MKLSLAIAAAALVATAPAAAVTTFAGTLSGAQETAPNASTATGSGTVLLSFDQNFITVNLSWQGLSAPAAAGHIHCCALLGANGPVAIDLEPVAATAGTIGPDIFDLRLASTWAGGFLNNTTNMGNPLTARTTFLNGLQSGRAYFNLHNANFPAGEIRGQIAMVPEPGAWAMMIVGFGVVGFAARRRRVALTA